MKRIGIVILLAFAAKMGIAQAPDSYLTINTNLMFAYGNTSKIYYPVVASFNDDFLQKVGGFGMGYTSTKDYGNGRTLKAGMNLTKMSQYLGSTYARDFVGNLAGFYAVKSSRINLNLNVLMQKSLGDKISLGTGIGVQSTLFHIQKLPSVFEVTTLYTNQTLQKNIMPVIPMEFNFETKKRVLTLRYEQALLNSNRGEFRKYKKETFGLLSFELGFKLN